MLKKLAEYYLKAESEVTTFDGKLAQLKGSFGNLQENIGNAVIQSTSLNEILSLVKVTMDQFGEATNKNLGPLGAFVNIVERMAEEIKIKLAPVLAILAYEQAKANKEARDIADAYDRGEELWIRMGWVTKIAATGLAILTKEQKELLDAQKIGFGSEIREKISAAEKALAAYIKTGEATPEGIKKLEIYTKSLKDSLRELNPVVAQAAQAMVAFGVDAAAGIDKSFDVLPERLKTLGAVVGGVLGGAIDYVEPKARGLFEGLIKQSRGAQRGFERVAASVEEMFVAIQRYSETAGAALGGLDAVIQQGSANRMIALDNEYTKRLALINASITDEDARQQAIAKLDDEFAAKRKKAAHALGLSAKAIAISNAIISTHEAAAKAMAQGGFILGIPWAAIIEALGWIQVGLIAAQPIPLAKGALFEKRTLLPAQYEVAEAGSSEIVSPVPMMRSIVREELGRIGSALAGSFTVNIQGPVFAVQSLSSENIARSAGEFWREMEGQARIRGFRLGGT
jgi:hypothetical protein